MTRKEVIAYAHQMGVRASNNTVVRWHKGYCTNGRGKKYWYFSDHRKLMFTDRGMGFGYTYQKRIVESWIRAIKRRKLK